MKKNGFTLVEFIAVIVILGLLITIAVPSVLSISEKIRNDMFCTKITNIEKAAEEYGSNHFNELKSINEYDITIEMLEGADSSTLSGYVTNGYVIQVNLLELIRNNNLNKDNEEAPYVVDPRDKNKSLDEDEVLIFKKNNRIYARYQLSTEDKKYCSE